MNSYIVTPHEGIGSLKLGMSPEEILAAVQRDLTDLKIVSKRGIQISEDRERDPSFQTLRYMEDIYFSMVRYQNGKAIEISVNWGLRDDVKVSLYGLDVFNTPAEDVIRFMKQIGPCIHDEPDEQLSTEYEFPALGIRFWRERACHEKLLQDRAYVEAMQLVLEEEKRYLYFDIVTVKI